MSDFIRVLGDDPVYSPKQTYQWITANSVFKVVPIYAVEDNGELWRCTADHERARLVSYRIFDVDGGTYTCASVGELQLLGIDTGAQKPHIGFIRDEGEDKPSPIDAV